jgi:hypothetical protein
MNIEQYAGLIVSAITIAVAFGGAVKWLVKHYLAELKPNGGSSIKDQVNRLEARVDEIFILLLEANKPKRKKTFVTKGEE